MRTSAKVDYAVRAVIELAVTDDRHLTSEAIGRAQDIPPKFLEHILSDLRRAGLIRSRRGAVGGYHLGRPASEITIADIIRAVDGPLATVRGCPPEEITYAGNAEALQSVWIAVRVSLRAVVERVTVADVAHHALPEEIQELCRLPEAWTAR